MNTQVKKKMSDVKLMVLVLSICFVFVVMAIIGAVVAIVGIVMTSYSNIPMFDSVVEMSGVEEYGMDGGASYVNQRSTFFREFFTRETKATASKAVKENGRYAASGTYTVGSVVFCAYEFETETDAQNYYGFLTKTATVVSYSYTNIGSVSVGEWTQPDGSAYTYHYAVRKENKAYHISSNDGELLDEMKLVVKEILK
jgi:hypothetical protein